MRRLLFILLFALAGTAAAEAGENAYDAAAHGFRAYSAGDYETAVAAFDDALALNPALANVAAQRGYALKALARNKEAAQSFRMAIALGSSGEDGAYAREIQTLENRFDFSFYSVYRPDAESSDFLAVAGPSLTQSQSGLQMAWTPPVIGYRDGRTVQLYSRLLWGYDGNSFKIRDDSFQAGAGLRWKPFQKNNLVLSGERLIAVGDAARNDWMLRTSYGWDQGYAFDGKKSHWRYMTFYADAAIIDPAHPDLFLLAEGRYGESFRFGRMLTVTPHAILAAVLQDDHFSTTSIIEAGPGLSVKLTGNGSGSGWLGSSLEFLIQYRQKIAGDSIGTSGFVFTLALQY